jgi:hypothetical protein
MTIGTVESISKTSLIVTVGNEAQTLTGPAVEVFVKNLKLGDQVEFTVSGETGITETIRRPEPTSKTVAPKPPATQRASSSPTSAFTQASVSRKMASFIDNQSKGNW